MKMNKVWILLSCLVISSLAAALNDYLTGPSRYYSGNTRYPEYNEYSEYPEYQQPPQYSNNFWRIIPWTINPKAPEPWKPYNYFRILRQQNDILPSTYRYSYATENQIQVGEVGYVSAQDTNNEMGTNARGFYEYVGDDGLRRRVDYTADERGFLPTLTIVPATGFNPEQVIKSAPDWNFAVDDRPRDYNNNFGAYQTDTKPVSVKKPKPFKSKDVDVKSNIQNNKDSGDKIDSKVADVFNNEIKISSPNPTLRESKYNLPEHPEPITKETQVSEDNLDSDDDIYSKVADVFNNGIKTTTPIPKSRESEDNLYNIQGIQEETKSEDINNSDVTDSKIVDVYNNGIKSTTLNPNSRESEDDYIPKLTGGKSLSEDAIDSDYKIYPKDVDVINKLIEVTTLKSTSSETENNLNEQDKPEAEDNIDSDEEVFKTTPSQSIPKELEDDVELLERKFVFDTAVTSKISEGKIPLKSSETINHETESPPVLKDSTSSIINNKGPETKSSDSQMADDAIAENQSPEIIDNKLKTQPAYKYDTEQQSKSYFSDNVNKSPEMVNNDTSNSEGDAELQTLSDAEEADPSFSNNKNANSKLKNDPLSIDNKSSKIMVDVNNKPPVLKLPELQLEASSANKTENENIANEVTIKNNKIGNPECHDDLDADSDCEDDNL